MWGGPRIRWADRQDPKVMVFVLDDKAEVKDYESVCRGVEIAVRSLSTMMDALCDVIVPMG